MPKHPAAGNAPALPTRTPSGVSVLHIAQVAAAAYKDENDFGGKALNASRATNITAGLYYDHASRDSGYLASALAAAVSCFEAQSLPEAIAQVAYAIDRLSALWDGVPEEGCGHHAKSDHAALERMLHSVLRCLEKDTGLTRERLGVAIFAGRHTDPWTTPEERLQLVKEEGVNV